MKHKILTKLATGQDLNPTEISFLEKQLSDNPVPTLKFNHESRDVFNAVGISMEDIKETQITINMIALKQKLKTGSVAISQVFEEICRDEKLLQTVAFTKLIEAYNAE